MAVRGKTESCDCRGIFNKLIENLSRFRTELMGVAIIMVMFCHNTIQISDNRFNFIWKSISSYSQVGVDIFLILYYLVLDVCFQFKRLQLIENLYGGE